MDWLQELVKRVPQAIILVVCQLVQRLPALLIVRNVVVAVIVKNVSMLMSIPRIPSHPSIVRLVLLAQQANLPLACKDPLVRNVQITV